MRPWHYGCHGDIFWILTNSASSAGHWRSSLHLSYRCRRSWILAWNRGLEYRLCHYSPRNLRLCRWSPQGSTVSAMFEYNHEHGEGITGRGITHVSHMVTTHTHDHQSHVQWDCTYHLVVVPKYRKHILFQGIRNKIKEIIKDLARRFDFQIIKWSIWKDHIHMVLRIAPKYSVAGTIGKLKGKSAIIIHNQLSWFGTHSTLRTRPMETW